MKKIENMVEMRPQERRSHVRYPFTAAADVIESTSNTRISARTADLARGGCFIDATNPFPIGTSVTVRLTFQQKTFITPARVVYSLPGMGMGLAFSGVEPDQLWVLERWLAELSGGMPPELNAPPIPESNQNARMESQSSAESGFVLNELIITLMRKKILTQTEGKVLLQKLIS